MASLKESRRYGQLIVRTAQQYPPGPLRDRLDRLSKPVEQWLANLNRLEQGLRQLYSQRNLARELRQTNFEIDELRRRLLTVDGNETAFLRELMQSKQNHLAVLKELQGFQTQAELKIRKIASDLGATHAEMLLLVAKGDFNENRFRRLDENLQEHVSSMRDVLGAMEELGYTSASG
jgi:chromosome segregation ATPase